MTEHHRRTRYGRYSGGPDPLAPPVDLSEALDAIGDEVMAGYSPEGAMREFLRRGGRDTPGLDDLAQRLAEKRREMLRRHDLDGTLRDVRELLDKAVLAERKQLARSLDDDARFQEMRIENLPPSTAAAVTELADYSWRSSEARESYEQIRDLLGREALDQRFAGMKQALENATEDDRAEITQMMRDLTELLRAHGEGRATDEDFREFMDRWGHHFPENPQSIDELIDTLASRAAAAQRMLNSMTPEQRDELMQLSQQAFGSPDLQDALGDLDATLQDLRPGEDWTGSEQFSGEQGLGLGDGTGALQDLAELDALAEQLAQAHPGAQLDDIDLEALGRHLGEDSAVDARTLAELEKSLRESGYLCKGGDGALTLSPKALRRLGRELLRDADTRLSARSGERDTRLSGATGERTGASRPWEFGDTEPWDVTRSLTNAIQRTAADGHDVSGGAGRAGGIDLSGGVRIGIDDVEVVETEARTRSAVALLVDTSFSMVMDGRWVPMKRTALALHHLVSTRFRGDDLELISFGRFAQTMDIAELTGLEGEWAKGTNLHHALLLANRFFRRHAGLRPVLLIVTDGEPTSHLLPDGEPFFDYPPHPMTIAVTVEELEASRRLGAATTFFRLGEDPGLARFIDAMARRVDGHVVAPELDDLGAAVVGEYLGWRDEGADRWTR